MTDLQESPQNDERDPAKGDTQPPNPVGDAAARVLAERAAEESAGPPRRRAGRPVGSRDSRPRKRDRKRDRSARPAPQADEPPPPAPEATEAELAGIGVLVGTVWRIAGARLRRRPLTDPEQLELARVAHPVLAKYGGEAFDKWGAEIALGVTLFGLWQQTELPPDPDALAAAELGEGAPA